MPRTVTAVTLDPADETCREYERVVDVNYLDQIRLEAKQFSTKRVARQSGCRVRDTTLRETGTD